MFSGQTYSEELDGPRLNSQLGRVFSLMVDGKWRTLGEILAATGDPEASISARLRDFRKPQFGGHTMESERIDGGLWRYRLLCEGKPIEPKPGTLFDDTLVVFERTQTPHGLEFAGRALKADIEDGHEISESEKQALRDAYAKRMKELKERWNH